MKGLLKSLVLSTSFLFFCFGKTFGQSLWSNAHEDSKLIMELKDAYRAFYINNIIVDQTEMITVLLNDDNISDTKKSVANYIKICDSLKTVRFNNDTLNKWVHQYLESTILNYSIGLSKGFTSPDFKKNLSQYEKVKVKYFDYLYNTYSTSRFISMTEEKYWQTNDKKNYIKSTEYEKYKSAKNSDLKSALSLLDRISKQATDFQEQSIYEIEWADQYVKQSDSLGNDADQIAIEKYKSILDQKKYSIYLFEAWVKWRAVTQHYIYGLSATSEIPNGQYNKERGLAAQTILEYIANHESDEMAINEFLLMATHDIVKRFGDYPYGNQNTIEYHELFDEKK